MKRFLKLIFTAAFLICICSSAFSDDKYIVVDVEGKGKTRDEAIESAWLAGIRQAVGTFIDSKQELKDDKLTERIIAYSRGLVEKYEVTGVDDSRADRGIYAVNVRMWIVQELLRDGAQHASSGSAEITFSPNDIKRQKEELDAKSLEARNAAEETSRKKAITGAELLGAMLERYKPENFLSCYIPGKPEPVKGKADTFTLNIEVSFNGKLYSENFVPDLEQVLEQIAESKKNILMVKQKNELRTLSSGKTLNRSDTVIFEADGLGKGYTLAVYDKPERFGARLYSFRKDEAPQINEVLKKFVSRTARVKGILLELQDENRETIGSITEIFALQYLVSQWYNSNVWAVHDTATINNVSEGAKFTVPIEIELPEEVLPYVKFFKASLIIGELAKGWLGNLVQDRKVHPDYYGEPIVDYYVKLHSIPGNSPAYKTGLRAENIITAINGKPVKLVSQADAIIDSMYEGDVVVLEFYNGREITVTLTAKP